MTVVSPRGSVRDVADALNRFASKFGTGSVVLGDGDATAIGDARISPRSVLILSPESSGADASSVLPVLGDGVASLEHGTGRDGEAFRYVIVNL